MTNPYSLDPASGQSIATSSDWTYQSTSATPLTSSSFPLTETSSDGDPFCTQEFCDYEDIYRSRFFRLDSNTGTAVFDINRTGSVVDDKGFIYVTHIWNPANASQQRCYGPVVTKVSQDTSDISIVWTRQYKSADNVEIQLPANLVLDASNNLWVIYTTAVPNSSGLYETRNYHFLRVSKNSGDILFSKSFAFSRITGDRDDSNQFYAIVDASGSWYLGSYNQHKNGYVADLQPTYVPCDIYGLQKCTYTDSPTTPWIVKLNNKFEIQWGTRWTGRRSVSNNTFDFYTIGTGRILHDVKVKGDYVYAMSSTGDNFATGPTFSRINTATGIYDLSWPSIGPISVDSTPGLNNIFPYALDLNDYIYFAGGTNKGNALVVDSQQNVYIAGRYGFSVENLPLFNNGIVIFKVSHTGALVWAKHYDIPGTTISNTEPCIHISANDRIYIGLNANFRASILEINTSGQVVSVREYNNTSSPAGDRLCNISTYAYSPETLLCRFSFADHIDTTQEVEVFDVPNAGVGRRTMEELPSNTYTQTLLNINLSRAYSFHVNYWPTLRSDFYTYSNLFTVTTPDRATVLYDIGQIRD